MLKSVAHGVLKFVRILIVVLLSQLITSCIEDDIVTKHCQLISRKDSIVGGSAATWKYTYSSAGKLTSVTVTELGEVTTYEYDAQGRVQKLENIYFVVTYDFNDAGQLESELLVFKSTQPDQLTNYTYNAEGQLVKQETHDTEYTFTYPDEKTRNPSSKSYEVLGGTVVLYYEYDDKPNPDRALFDFPYLPMNNVTKITSVSPPAPGSDGVGTTTIAYEYSAEGLPTKSTETYSNSDLVQIKEFAYLCF